MGASCLKQSTRVYTYREYVVDDGVTFLLSALAAFYTARRRVLRPPFTRVTKFGRRPLFPRRRPKYWPTTTTFVDLHRRPIDGSVEWFVFNNLWIGFKRNVVRSDAGMFNNNIRRRREPIR